MITRPTRSSETRFFGSDRDEAAIRMSAENAERAGVELERAAVRLFNRLERYEEALQCYEQALRTQEKMPGVELILTRLAAEVESHYAATHSRFSASSAYFDLVSRRIADIADMSGRNSESARAVDSSTRQLAQLSGQLRETVRRFRL